MDIQVFNYPYRSFEYSKQKIYTVNYNKILIAEIDKTKKKITAIDSINVRKKIMNGCLNKTYGDIITFATYENIYLLKTANDKFKKYIQFSDDHIRTRGIVSDQQDNLYVASYSGLYKLSKNKELIREKPGFHNSLLMDTNSKIWSISDNNRLRKMNLETHKETVFDNSAKGLYSIFFKRKSQDSLWVGTNKGIQIFNMKDGSVSRYFNKGSLLENTVVTDLLKTKRGTIWFAGENGLFLKRKNESIINYKQLNKAFNYKEILVLYEDCHQNIWAGTKKDGVIFINVETNKTKAYNQTSGLSNNTVCGILESKNKMWFSTFYGLSSLDKRTQLFDNFYKEDGLSDNEFNLRSVYRKNDTVFYFGGMNGIIEFNPEKINAEKKRYQLFFSNEEYFSKKENKNIKKYFGWRDNTIDLPYNKNFFSAEFTVNDVFNNQKNTYLYKIDGLVDNWVDIGTSGIIKLYRLPPGDHVLQVKGKNFEGVDTLNQIKIPIHVDTVFFKTIWFIVLMFVLIGGGIICLFRRKKLKMNKIFLHEQTIIQLKSGALKEQMNPHFIFNVLNNIQSVMILKKKEEADTYFTAFSKLLHLTLDVSKQELVLLSNEIEYINSYLMLNKLQNEDLFFFIKVSEEIPLLGTVMIPGMLIQPFVENAILHGLANKKVGDKKLYVNYYIENEYLTVTVEDNGVGRTAAAILQENHKKRHRSWATDIVNDRIEIMNTLNKNAIIIYLEDLKTNDKPSGTKVTLKFKLIKDA